MGSSNKSAGRKIEKYLTKKRKSQDFDIENEEIAGGSSSNELDNSESDEDENTKKEHYVSVGKSSIREEIAAKNKKNSLLHEGKKVSRDELYNSNANSSESLSENNDSESENNDSEAESNSEDKENFEAGTDEESVDESEEKDDDESEEESTVTVKPVSAYEQFSQLKSKDVIKGKSIVKQNQEFNSILDVRMQLQKAMSIYNNEYSNDDLDGALIKIAKENNTLLKDIIVELNKKRLHLHKKDQFTMKGYNFEDTKNYKKVTKKLNETLNKYNRVTLSKWSKKTLQADHSLLDHLDNVLLDKHKLILQLRQPKFNDLQFYKNMLNQLIQQKLNSTNNSTQVSNMSNKPIEIRLIKKDNSGNKSSKGRKLDYTVQQKLVNFETPNNSNNRLWDDFKRDEFFVGLFGRKVDIWSMDNSDESSDDGEDNIDDDEAAIANDVLTIFG